MTTECFLKFSGVPKILGNPGTSVIPNILGILSQFPEKIPIPLWLDIFEILQTTATVPQDSQIYGKPRNS